MHGVDLGKFTGPLEPITSAPAGLNSPPVGGFEGYRVWANSLEFAGSVIPPGASDAGTLGRPQMAPDEWVHGRYNTSRIPVALETFNRLTYLPAPVVESMISDLLPSEPGTSQTYVQGQVPCLWLDDPHYNATFTFVFKTESRSSFPWEDQPVREPLSESVRIEVPVTDLIHRTNGLEGDQCFLGVMGTEIYKSVLGTNVLKEDYWVFDWAERKVKVAKAMDCGSRVVMWLWDKVGVIGDCGNGKVKKSVS